MPGLPERLARWSKYTALVVPLVVVYVLSYAPFLLAVTVCDSTFSEMGYRAPAVYRMAEWCIVRTPAQRPLLKWSECFQVRGTVELQAWYFAQGVDDPSTDCHFSLQHE